MKTILFWLAALALFLSLSAPAGAQVPQFVNGSWHMPERHAAVAASDDWIVEEIYSAAAANGLSGDYLLSVAMCESGLDPNAVGIHGELGVFQVDPAYWGVMSTGEQIWWSAEMIASGYGYLWVCA